ncbi:MAG: hypothetical protein JWM37_764 [Candidatus Saccharibacteria bacterium]|nr:hypothetical protein [Candidatus Saccharibacteria bacterium]
MSNTLRHNQNGSVIASLIYVVFGVMTALCLLRFLLELLNANSLNGFVMFVYNASEPLVAPFRGIFNQSIIAGQRFFDIAALTAVAVYGLIGALISGVSNRR